MIPFWVKLLFSKSCLEIVNELFWSDRYTFALRMSKQGFPLRTNSCVVVVDTKSVVLSVGLHY